MFLNLHKFFYMLNSVIHVLFWQLLVRVEIVFSESKYL